MKIHHYALVGVKTNSVYYQSTSKSDVFRWLNAKTESKSDRKTRGTVDLPEPLRFTEQH